MRLRVLALLGLVLLAAVVVFAQRPPRPNATAGDTEFAAGRASTHLAHFADSPRPTGSPAASRTREYLRTALADLGLTATERTSVAARTFADRTHLLGSVTPLHAVLRGRESTGAVLLVAHYDSVPLGPGAADDGANVAAVLEVVRALRAGPGLRNDVHVLFTDAEEPGLLGARAFVDSGVPADAVVLNLEARGVSGPALMFQTSGPAGGLMPALRASGALTTSVSADIYRLLPNDSDLTVFDEAGVRGLNFAFIGGSAHYHTATDDIAHLDAGSVQDMGDAVLAAARVLGDADLAAADPGAAHYFSVLGLVVHYPAWSTLPLAALTALGLLGLCLRLRCGLAALRVGASLLLPVLAAGAAAFGLWWLLGVLRPEYALLPAGDPYQPGPHLAALAVLTAALLLVWRGLLRGAGEPALALGVLGVHAVLGLLLAVLLPGGAYLFTLPALVGLLAVALTGRPAAASLGAVPAVLVLLPVVLLLTPALGLAGAAGVLVPAALLATTALPLLRAAPPRRPVVLTALPLAVALVATGVLTEGYDEQRPKPVSLGYAVDGDRGSARWLGEGEPDPAFAALLPTPPAAVDELPNLTGRSLRTGPAQVAASVPAPVWEHLGDRQDGGLREYRVRLRTPGNAYAVAVYADVPSGELVEAVVDGRAVPGGRNRRFTTGPWGWGFGYTAPPAAGFDVVLRVRGGDAAPRLRAVSQTNGLPSDADAPALAPDRTQAAWPSPAGQSYASRTIELSHG
ncbi:M20/M25/M40 family metallo-hydrolase [Actinosynnema sp. NPDC047251]|uniref:Aminopeptidase n=1 Tax=Saccharothrix espanaensis (strain ATCC 51144 / DSM 44229 / JCM 9112 / NBRC 15066 / NRRL 15764) TaxID=1179773 RepID=K0K3M4_SACES|nr:M20/M25/M40 family metallo-hydrolase [Saccharothrix espanaensis]CCH32926.1 Aminopeptidase [Saccharothrix espanaensis DSM 44229]